MLTCAECGAATDVGRGRVVLRIDEPGETPQLAAWCQDCAKREQLVSSGRKEREHGE